MQKKIILLLVSLILFISGCGSSAEHDDLSIVNEFGKSVVLIREGSSHGSGVVIDVNETYIVVATVAHLVEGFDQAIVSFAGGETLFGNITYSDSGSDVAIVKVETQYVDDLFLKTIEKAKVDMNRIDETKIDEEAYLIGSAVDISSNATEGIIKSKDYFIPEFDENLLYLYADAMPGMSGGGVFDTDGYLLGIISAGSDTAEVLAIPINYYLELN